jgi:transcriptional regulator with GAF, ATPase, and Fis domain
METIELDNNRFLKLESVIELASVLSGQNNFDEVLRLVTKKSSDLLNADAALIMMLNPSTHRTIKTIVSEEKNKDLKKLKLVHTNISGWVIKNQKSFFSSDIRADDRFTSNLFIEISFLSIICLPIKSGGNVIGTLFFLRESGKESYKESDLLFAEKLLHVVTPYLYNVQSIQEFFICPLPEESIIKKYNEFGLIGRSSKFIEMLKSIEAASKCNVRVLLEGETGTGKELVAKAIYKLSQRYNNKFVVVDCGAIPANLIESELFGHVKGAFTGANYDRKGLLESSNGGTLFIDEINCLPFEVQSKFLRFLQENEFRPLGSNITKNSVVRVIAASNISLASLVNKKLFREDLFFRLNVYPIYIPSLNERQEDINYLANHFLKKFAQLQNKSAELFDNEITLLLNQRKWTGNIRELENFVERIISLIGKDVKIIKADLLSKEMKDELKRINDCFSEMDSSHSLNDILSRTEENLIRQALVNYSWNQTKAAQSLKIPEQTLRYKMNKYGIHKSS